MALYEDVITEVQNLLSAETEWKDRYNKYIDIILKKAKYLKILHCLSI